MSPLSDASIAALVRTAAARRGRTRKCEIGIGTGGGGACLKPSGASPLRGTLKLVKVILFTLLKVRPRGPRCYFQ